MNKRYILLLVSFFILRFDLCLVSSDYEKVILQDIVKKIESYKNKKITLKLRLKNFDSIFDKLIFYDRKNNDIVFDISIIKKKKEFQSQVLNLHEGMEYLVNFTIKDVGNIGEIIGDLISFKPLVLFKLPDGNN